MITIGQLLGMAAHLEGKGIVTQDAAGLAQKGGATWSHIQIANRMDAILTTKVGTAEADLVIGCDPIVAANKSTLALMREGRTFVALNTHGTPTAAFVTNPDWQFPAGNCDTAIAGAAGSANIGTLDADQLAVQLVGDSLYTNPLMLGYAWQKGRVPLSHAALMRAIELNGVQVENNKLAFEWGRRAAHDLAAVQALTKPAQVIEFVKKTVNLDEMIAKRVEFLTAYQDAAYAQTYKAFVDKVRAVEAPLNTKKLTEAVARYLFKLMAYKDEYEVARLHSDPAFLAKVASQFEGDYTLELPPRAAADREEERQGRAAEVEVRPVDADRLPPAREAEEPARHRARPVRQDPRAQDRARADRRVPRRDRRSAGRAEPDQPAARARASRASRKRSAATAT